MNVIEAERERIQTEGEEFLAWVEAERAELRKSAPTAPTPPASPRIPWGWLVAGLSVGAGLGAAITGSIIS